MEDAKLVQLMRAGDEAAFDAIYDRYVRQLYRSAYLICGNPHDAEDAVQEAFVKCVTCIDQLRSDESLRFWLYRILVRAARSISKRGARERADEHVADRLDALAQSTGSAASHAQEQSRDSFEQWLVGLSPAQREAVVLHYYDDMSVHDIAALLDCREGTVKSRLFAARKQLRKTIQNPGCEVGRHAYQN